MSEAAGTVPVRKYSNLPGQLRLAGSVLVDRSPVFAQIVAPTTLDG